MHSKSQQKVLGWGNTILGQRKKKLLSLEEKARIAEVIIYSYRIGRKSCY